MSLLERCPHFRGCYVQTSMELGPEDVSLLERCPHFRGCYVQEPEHFTKRYVYCGSVFHCAGIHVCKQSRHVCALLVCILIMTIFARESHTYTCTYALLLNY